MNHKFDNLNGYIMNVDYYFNVLGIYLLELYSTIMLTNTLAVLVM